MCIFAIRWKSISTLERQNEKNENPQPFSEYGKWYEYEAI